LDVDVSVFLSQAFLIERVIAARRQQIADLRDKLDWAGGSTAAQKRGASRRDRISWLVARIADKIAECEHDIARLIDAQDGIKRMIDGLADETQKLILTERYINLKDWQAVADANGYSIRTVYRIRKEAVAALQILALNGSNGA